MSQIKVFFVFYCIIYGFACLKYRTEQEPRSAQVYLAEELTRKLDRADYAIKEAEQKLKRMRAEFERQLAAVRSGAAAARRDLERLRKDAERQEKSALANLSSSKSHSDRLQAKPKGSQAKVRLARCRQ